MKNFFYRCSECDSSFDITPSLMLCPNCQKHNAVNTPLRGILQVDFKDITIKDSANIYDFLPVEKKYFPPIPVGNTPLWKPLNLSKELNLKNLFIKDDSANPTASFKDRASFLVGAFANKHHIDEIVLASTGNAASSMAGVGAAAGIKITIFLPRSAPKAKMVQSMQYGANVILVDGNYDKAYELSLQYSKEKKVLSRNTAYNPLTIEGKKTVSIEIFNQLSRVPDYLFVPVGDGVILSGVFKGFCDLLKLGFIDKIPVIYAVQASGSDAIFRAINNNGEFNYQSTQTIADSICVDVPRCGYLALKYLQKYNGKCVTITDQEILSSQKKLSETSGLFTEPAGAASLAGLLKVKEDIPKNAFVVLLTTGSGLKDTESALQGIHKEPITINNIENI